MSDESARQKKIARGIKKITSINDEEKIRDLSKAVDEFAQFILQCYLDTK